MSNKDRDKFRSYPSGSSKRQKKKQREENLNKQRGSFDKFVTLSLNSTQLSQNSLTENSKNIINDEHPVLEVDVSEKLNKNYKFDYSSSIIEIDNEVEKNKFENEIKSSDNGIINHNNKIMISQTLVVGRK